MEQYSYWKAAEEELPRKGNRAFERLASAVSEVARERQLPRDEFSYAVKRLYDAYGEFLYATNAMSVEPVDQVHWYNRFRDVRLGKKLGEPALFSESLSGAAYSYLKGPLRVAMFDRALLDALIAQETFAYIDGQAGRGAFLTQFGCVGGYLVIAVLWALLFGGTDTNWGGYWKFAVILSIPLLLLWVWPKRGVWALYREMRNTYQILTGSVVSVPELRRRVERARDRGVVWPAELYAVLDDVEARTKVL